MERRMRVGLVLTGVVVCVAGACDAGEMMADAMVDAGEMLRDASSDDAAAQLDGDTPASLRVISVEVPCDVVREETGLQETDGSAEQREFRWTHWYARLEDDRIDPSSVVSAVAVACDREVLAEVKQCEPGSVNGTHTWTCTGEAPLEPLRCRTIPLEIEAGQVRASCGSREEARSWRTDTSEWTEWSIPPDQSVSRFTSVRVSIAIAQ